MQFRQAFVPSLQSSRQPPVNRMQIYPGKRFWVPREGRLRLDERGYLADPDAHAHWNPDVVAWESLRDHFCLILLGEPGAGKSTALQQAGLTAEAPARVYVNLRGYSDQHLLYRVTFGSDRFATWCDGAG